MNKTIIFDIDSTLFNVEKFLRIISEKLQAFFPGEDMDVIGAKTYREIRQFGPFDPRIFTEQLLTHVPSIVDKDTLEEIWWNKDTLQDCMYPEVDDMLKKIANKDNRLAIFSSGGTDIQYAKIESIKKFFHPQDIHVYIKKDDMVDEVFGMFKYSKIFYFDDFMPVLKKAKEYDSDATTIHVKRGKFADAYENEFRPDYSIYTLEDVIKIIK